MHLNSIERWFQERQKQWLEISIVSMIILTMLALYVFSVGFPVLIVNLAPFLVILLLTFITVPAFTRGSLTSAIMLLGFTCVAGTFLVIPYAISNNMLNEKTVIYITNTFAIGMGTLIISIIMIYKPELLYAKNRPKNDAMPDIWKSDYAQVSILVPLRKLLSEAELHLLPNYNYVFVSIDGKIYLVPPQEAVPESSLVIRKHGYFLGIRKIYDGYFF